MFAFPLLLNSFLLHPHLKMEIGKNMNKLSIQINTRTVSEVKVCLFLFSTIVYNLIFFGISKI